MSEHQTFPLFGFQFATSGDRQDALENHARFREYMAWREKGGYVYGPAMDDYHDREQFEAFLGGAFDEPPTLRGWVSIREEMPEILSPVLCFESSNHAVVLCIWDGEKWIDCTTGSTMDVYCNITHWQPIPQPPKFPK